MRRPLILAVDTDLTAHDRVFHDRLGDQRDQAQRTAAAALALQAEIEQIGTHPDWPRFRVGLK